MSWFQVKIDEADRVFSKYIRLRDGECVVCGRKGEGKEKITGLQNSHFFSRRKESTRYDVENCDALCISCHRYFGEHKTEYEEFKKKQLGENVFYALMVRANQTVKKDRYMSLLVVKELLKSLNGKG